MDVAGAAAEGFTRRLQGSRWIEAGEVAEVQRCSWRRTP
jgi:hypothetical protein